MKKYIAIASLLLLAPLKAMAFADLEYGMWSQTSSSSVTVPGPTTNSMGPTGSSQGMLRADLDFHIPLIPRMLVKSTSLYATGGGNSMTAQTMDAIAYWQLPFIDVVRWGGGLSYFPATFSSTAYTGTLPGAALVGYLGLRLKFLDDKFHVGYDMTRSLVANVTSSSTDLFVSYQFLGPLGAKFGKRTESIGANDGAGNSFVANGNGIYASVFMHI